MSYYSPHKYPITLKTDLELCAEIILDAITDYIFDELPRFDEYKYDRQTYREKVFYDCNKALEEYISQCVEDYSEQLLVNHKEAKDND